ncbi:hypothetical protein ACFLZY_03550, partial [Patescibacteria group bacterium]
MPKKQEEKIKKVAKKVSLTKPKAVKKTAPKKAAALKSPTKAKKTTKAKVTTKSTTKKKITAVKKKEVVKNKPVTKKPKKVTKKALVKKGPVKKKPVKKLVKKSVAKKPLRVSKQSKPLSKLLRLSLLGVKFCLGLAVFSSISLVIYSVLSFTPVVPEYSYQKAIDYLSAQNYLSDLGRDSKAVINRGEFLKLLNKIVEFEPGEIDQDCYVDLTGDPQTDQAICQAKAQGWLTYKPKDKWMPSYGVREITFRPNEPITFVEALRFTMTAFNQDVDYSDAPWYKKMITQASEQKLIPLTITDSEQELTLGQVADLLSRLLNSQSQTLDLYLGQQAQYQATFQTISAKQDVSTRIPNKPVLKLKPISPTDGFFKKLKLKLSNSIIVLAQKSLDWKRSQSQAIPLEDQCFHQGQYYDHGLLFDQILDDNSCQTCQCQKGQVSCQAVTCQAEPIEQIRPLGEYELSFQACQATAYQPAAIGILDSESNLADLKNKVESFEQGRTFISEVLDSYNVCLTSAQKDEVVNTLAQKYQINEKDSYFLINTAHL